MSARATRQLRHTFRSVPLRTRQASSQSSSTRPGSLNSLLVGGSVGLALLAGAALATKYGTSTEKRQSALDRLQARSSSRPQAATTEKPALVTEPQTGKPVEVSSTSDTGEITTTQAQASADEDQSQQAAFDPETGQINWDCPCLGGMAYGPCGEEFKEAFSCFVFSDQEPKGVDCIEKFKGMQDCFRRYPDVYEKELAGVEDDEDLDNESVTTVSTPDSETSSADLNPLSKPEESYVEVPTNSPSEGQPQQQLDTEQKTVPKPST